MKTNVKVLFHRKSTDSNRSFRVDEFCACPSESEDWYRGLIRQLHSDGTATVFKIDYGDVQDIPMKFLQPLKVIFRKRQKQIQTI